MNKKMKSVLKWLKRLGIFVILYLAFDTEIVLGVALAVTLFLIKLDYEDDE